MMIKVSQAAHDLGMSRFAIYEWIKTGIIPEYCIIRIGQSIRINSDRLDRLVREGKIYRQRMRTPRLKNPEGSFVTKKHLGRGNAQRKSGRIAQRPLRRLEGVGESIVEVFRAHGASK